MLNFAVGPVMSSKETLDIGAQQVPYFRTEEFSKVMLDNEKYFLKYLYAPKGAKAVFITGSGTASMEASVINTLSSKDKALVVNGGSFGHRFCEILSTYDVPFEEVKLDFGKGLTKEDLLPFENKGFTAFLINLHETSTGVKYDPKLVGDFCKRNNLFLIVDTISCFLTDEINMSEMGADIVITGSQKALACAPGISLIALSERAQERVNNCERKIYYLSIKSHLKDMERGQTPFTPAVGILLQIHARFEQIERDGGIKVENERSAYLAKYFREKIKDLPFEITSNSLSNAVTPLHPLNVPAYSIFLTLKDEYGIWICPNGGELKDKVFRVGHMGFLQEKDYDTLVDAFKDMQRRGLL